MSDPDETADGESDEGGDGATGENDHDDGDDSTTEEAHLPESDLQYPTLAFESGSIDPDGGFDCSTEADREEMQAVARDLAGALASHDLGVEAPDGTTTLGIAPEGVDVAFDPDEDHVGDLEVTFRLRAKSMVVADEDAEAVGARGGKGFVPLSTLTDDADQRRCYGWIEDPGDPE